MAYRFQDLNGDWRIRYDDGSTSPVIGNVSSRLQDSTFEFSEGTMKEDYGVDDSFSSSKFALRGAIIEQAASSDRIATYQKEFDPVVASGADGQNLLINKVLANPAADIEARAAAAQALYPGMEARVGVNGELSFSASNSTLGFNYPNKTAAQVIDPQTKRATGSEDNDYNSVVASMNGLIQDMSQASDPTVAATLMSQAMALATGFKDSKQRYYKDLFERQYNVQGLEAALKQNKLLDEQNHQTEPWTRQYGDSPATKTVEADLTIAKTRYSEDLQSAIAGDTELSFLLTLTQQAQAIGTAITGEIIATPSLIPQDAQAVLNATYNDDGSPLTNEQLRELNKKLSSNDPVTGALVNLATAPIQQIPLMGAGLPNSLQGSAKRIFERAIGAGGEGKYDEFKSYYNNFDKFLEATGTVLTAAQADAIKAADPKGAIADKDMLALRKQEADNVKRQVLEGYFKAARDAEQLKDIVSGNAVPDNSVAAELWRGGVMEAKARRESELRVERMNIENGRWDFTTAAKVDRKERLAKFDKDRPTREALSLDDVIKGFTRKFMDSEAYSGDIASDAYKAEAMIADFIKSQSDEPKLKNWLGSNTLLDPTSIRGWIITEMGREQAARARQNFH